MYVLVYMDIIMCCKTKGKPENQEKLNKIGKTKTKKMSKQKGKED